MTAGKFQRIGNLDVTGNMTIQYLPKKVDEGTKEIPNGSSKVIFENGKVDYQRSRDGKLKHDSRDEFYCDSKVSTLLVELSALDGKNDLSIKDLKLAKKLQGLVLGYINNNRYEHNEVVTKVDMSNIKNGEVTITTTSGYVLHVNAETEEEKAEKEALEAKYNLSEENYKAAEKRGRDMQDCLHGYTTDGDWSEFEEYVAKTDAGNVLQTLRGFEYEACDDSAIWNSERFFQQLFTENRDKDQKIKVAQQIINNVSEYIRENKANITDEATLQTLNDIEVSLANANLANNMSNNFGKLLDNKMHQLFEIFKIDYKY